MLLPWQEIERCLSWEGLTMADRCADLREELAVEEAELSELQFDPLPLIRWGEPGFSDRHREMKRRGRLQNAIKARLGLLTMREIADAGPGEGADTSPGESGSAADDREAFTPPAQFPPPTSARTEGVR